MSDINILVIDDEPQVHTITSLVLGEIEYKERKIVILDAYSSLQAIEILKSRNDIAVAIIDVVMEEEDSGLKLIREIRQTLNNRMLRILLRTGQPGSAPEKSVILEYDINDYREKTELSSQKLLTSVISCIRSYDDLCTISKYKEHLEELVAERTNALEKANKELQFYNAVIESDLEAGSKMQYKLLPSRKMQIGSITFSRYLISSRYLSGDFVDYFSIDNNVIGFYILDVSGHGTPSAFMTVIIKNFIDQQLEKYAYSGNSIINEPKRMAEYLNRELMREEYGKYFTMCYGIINENEKTFTYVNCGQFPFPILSIGDTANFISKGGPPIGLFAKPEYQEISIQLPEKFQLVFISDGILEFMSAETLDEKKEKLLSCIEGKAVTIEYMMDTLGLETEQQYTDDITFLLLER